MTGCGILADQLRDHLPRKPYGGVKPTKIEIRCSSFESAVPSEASPRPPTPVA